MSNERINAKYSQWLTASTENRLIATWVEAQNQMKSAETLEVVERWQSIAVRCENAIAKGRTQACELVVSSIEREQNKSEARLAAERARLGKEVLELQKQVRRLGFQRQVLAERTDGGTTKRHDRIMEACNCEGATAKEIASRLSLPLPSFYRDLNYLTCTNRLLADGERPHVYRNTDGKRMGAHE
jgi:hypothetical protein